MIILSDDTPTEKVPFVNWSLIFLNAAAFTWVTLHVSDPQHFVSSFGCVPRQLMQQHDLPQYLAIFTSMFLHGSALHLIGNMWALYLFGDNVEDRFGHVGYLAFYLFCGVCATLAHAFTSPSSMIPIIGASGAIAGVMAAYLALHPFANCKTWWGDDWLFFAFRTYEVPAWVVITFWFVVQLLLGWIFGNDLGVAIFAHVGGFIAGIVIVAVLEQLQHRKESGLKQSYPIALTLAVAGCFSLYHASQAKTPSLRDQLLEFHQKIEKEQAQEKAKSAAGKQKAQMHAAHTRHHHRHAAR